MSTFVIGFALGAIVAGLSILAVLGKYKFENARAKSLIEAMTHRVRQGDRQRGILMKNLIDSTAEAEYLKSEVDKLRTEKLAAWDVPGSL